MQENIDPEKFLYFKKAVGNVIRKLRKENPKLSINKLANEYEFNKGNLSKIERGLYSIYLVTAWRISESLGVKFSKFASLLEKELGPDFTFMDE